MFDVKNVRIQLNVTSLYMFSFKQMFNIVMNEALALIVFPLVLLSLKPMKNVCLGLVENGGTHGYHL